MKASQYKKGEEFTFPVCLPNRQTHLSGGKPAKVVRVYWDSKNDQWSYIIEVQSSSSQINKWKLKENEMPPRNIKNKSWWWEVGEVIDNVFFEYHPQDPTISIPKAKIVDIEFINQDIEYTLSFSSEQNPSSSQLSNGKTVTRKFLHSKLDSLKIAESIKNRLCSCEIKTLFHLGCQCGGK